ncbi:MAG: acriflavine resistance protein B [Planctomycetota bacterium]|nr:MAG: acriflavine resistance protein B [Planctomycetota bacterium]
MSDAFGHSEARGGDGPVAPARGIVDRLIRYCLHNRLVVFLILAFILLWGYRVMPFRVDGETIARDPIPVDAIPDIGENQQVIFTDWPGRSPQDVEDQITYPLTTTLQGTPGFRTIRAYSMFGFSVVYVIFDDQHDFYWCRSRLLEKLNVAQQRLPQGVTPALGPDATGLGQVFWYTLEGSHGGFDLMELRSTQDWLVRYGLQGIPGVSEVASVGGYVREYQIDVDPDAMRAHNVRLQDVFMAVQRANVDVGAETIEWNGAEYVVRGKGFVKSVTDVENIVLRVADNVPIYVKNVARVQIGPALRRGMLDKDGVEAVGGVVLVRYGANPLEVIERVKTKIADLAPGLPRKTLDDGRVTQVRIVPFYDRTTLIHETIDTLSDALYEQILITTFVVLMFLRHLRSCVVISVTMPLAVMICFILMKLFGVDSNLMSLGGIAIAIGTLVDMGIILTENIVRHIEDTGGKRPVIESVEAATREIGSAVTTAVLMTVIAFLPIFALEGPEGKLFRPLAYTKTFVLLGSLIAAILILPTLAHMVFSPIGRGRGFKRWGTPLVVTAAGAGLMIYGWFWAGLAAVLYGAYGVIDERLSSRARKWVAGAASLVVMAVVLLLLTEHWMPLGEGAGIVRNLIIVLGINLLWASVRVVFIDFYPYFLRLFLDHKIAFLAVPAAIVLFGATVWLGFGRTFSWLPSPKVADSGESPSVYSKAYSVGLHALPGLGREFMPPLDEGSFLYMPTLMPHVGIGATLEAISAQDRAIRAIPEVESVVGKVGRAETAIDPAPVSMIETIITYKTEYRRDPVTGELALDDEGRPIRQWRDHIRGPRDIWDEIQKAAEYPGVTGAPHLQPIAARLVMLQSGMRAPMGVKVFGKDLNEIEKVGYRIAEVLREVRGIEPATVVPDRVVGKPYLEIEIDRERMARYGVNIRDVQDVIEIALGGVRATMTVEGRERYPIRVRYPREERDSVEAIERVVVPGSAGEQVPLSQLATITYVRGPQEIKSEDNFLVSYVLFDKKPGYAEVDVVEEAARRLIHLAETGDLEIPAGVHYRFSGSYENQVRFAQRLSIILPISLFLLFLLLYFEFRSVPVSLIVFTGIPVAWAGGFIGIWLIGQPWFFNFSVFGENVRDLMHFGTYNLSAAVWVGFIALFSVTTDDGVVLATYLGQEFGRRRVQGIADIRASVISAGTRRVRPCLMTSATTVLSLMPILTSDGRGADVMIPIALPAVGGLSIELLSLFVLPVCYCWYKEALWKLGLRKGHFVDA